MFLLSYFTLFYPGLPYFAEIYHGIRMSVSPIPPLSTGTVNLFPDPSSQSSTFLAKIISHRLLSAAQDDGSGNTEKHHPIPSFSPLKFR